MTMTQSGQRSFSADRTYTYRYQPKKQERTPRHFENQFKFVETVRGNGVTHYLFRNIAGGYLLSFTENDFISGDVQML